MKIRISFLILLLLPFTALKAQKSLKDSVIFTNLISANYTVQFPGNDLADRYGMNSQVGLGYMIKTRHNWLLGVETGFMFGNQINDKENILKNIETEDGNIIDMEGIY
ncbi:MAG TPA: hypothetical protein PLM34_06970, partial [Lentimicrobium sp.]|nr:hypothetical protein [Lentimicrobium sp.]